MITLAFLEVFQSSHVVVCNRLQSPQLDHWGPNKAERWWDYGFRKAGTTGTTAWAILHMVSQCISWSMFLILLFCSEDFAIDLMNTGICISVSPNLCTIYFCCNPSSYPPLAASRQQSHLYKAGRGKGQEHEVRGDLPWDPVRSSIVSHSSNLFFANGCNTGMGKDVNDGQQRQSLVGNKMYRR